MLLCALRASWYFVPAVADLLLYPSAVACQPGGRGNRQRQSGGMVAAGGQAAGSGLSARRTWEKFTTRRREKAFELTASWR